MSKSKGNIVDPNQMIAKYGADTVRLFCLFAAPPERDFDWSESGIEGAFRFISRIWRLYADLRPILKAVPACSGIAVTEDEKALRLREHATVKKVSEDIGNRYQFNTAIAAVMELVNEISERREALQKNESGCGMLSSAMATVITLLAPFTPHVCEELWEDLGHSTSVSREAWPVWKEDALKKDVLTVVIQVNGKLRGKMEVPADLGRSELELAALKEPNAAKFIEGHDIVKIVVIPGKLVNVVVR